MELKTNLSLRKSLVWRQSSHRLGQNLNSKLQTQENPTEEEEKEKEEKKSHADVKLNRGYNIIIMCVQCTIPCCCTYCQSEWRWVELSWDDEMKRWGWVKKSVKSLRIKSKKEKENENENEKIDSILYMYTYVHCTHKSNLNPNIRMYSVQYKYIQTKCMAARWS